MAEKSYEPDQQSVISKKKNFLIISFSSDSNINFRTSSINVPVATILLGSITASVGTVESEGRQMKQC
jgi:hypothetical protein